MHHLLVDRVISAVIDGEPHVVNLPTLFASLTTNQLDAVPALRPHQRAPWHALTVQLAALALLRAERTDLPTTVGVWHDLLGALTPHCPTGWELVAPYNVPAFLQPPVAGAKPVSEWIVERTPDAIDVLVQGKVHETKPGSAFTVRPDDWLFALVALQTTVGHLGASNRGISRMNSGGGCRLFVGIDPDAHMRFGPRFRRDVLRLVAGEALDVCRAIQPALDFGGPALLWLKPWDGKSSLSLKGLHPLYIEIARCVRLDVEDGELIARRTGSKSLYIAAKRLRGLTGDPWAPTTIDDDGAKSLTPKALDYRTVANILLDPKFTPAPLQRIAPADDGELVVDLAVLIRGQGKTNGFHHRRVPVPRPVRSLLVRRDEALARIAETRIADIATIQKALWQALAVARVGQAARRHVIDGWEADVDHSFFNDLWSEASAADPKAIRGEWRKRLIDWAAGRLRQTIDDTLRFSDERWRRRTLAERRFYSAVDDLGAASNQAA